MKESLKIAVLGTGYWAQFQIAAWQDIGCEVVAVWNRTLGRAQDTAKRFNIPAVYETVEQLLEETQYDIVDIITDAEVHEELVLASADKGKPIICQKPMSLDEESCQRMVDACEKAGVWYAIHENFRYQPQFQNLKRHMETTSLGKVLHAHIQMRSPDRDIIRKQPALGTMEHMALRDMGPHIFDVVRFLFGEISGVLTIPVSSYHDIPVDDTALSLLRMQAGYPVLCTLAHRFHYKAFIQFEKGSITLDAQNNIEIESEMGAKMYPYQEPDKLAYIPEDDWAIHGGHVFIAIPSCLRALRRAYVHRQEAETSGRDNLKTMRAVFAAMRSVEQKQQIRL
ncbi:MAG: Gfo/Idh/MocA family protein [Christensenellales bacterium]|jgi:predicted dehydrogenase